MKNPLLKCLLPFGLTAALLAQNIPAHIAIVVTEGEGSASGTRQRVAQDPAVRIEDDDHRPVAGAAVVFALPVSGATGEFFNGSKNLAVVTDNDGLAVAHGLKTNNNPGKLQIYVTASYHGLRARTVITQMVEGTPAAQTRSPEPRSSKSSGKWKWVVLGIAAAGGAGAGLYFGTHTSSPAPVSIAAGTVVFGGPH